MPIDHKRLREIDILRGFIMIIMAIDHASFFIRKVHFSESWGLQIPAYRSFTEFLTRYVTHIAPTGFFILMGVGIALSAQKKKNTYYLKRGLFILILHVFLEFRIWNFVTYKTSPSVYYFGAFPGSSGPISYDLGVLFALSISLMFWGSFRKMRSSIVFPFSIVILFLPTLLIPELTIHTNPNLLEQLLYTPYRGNGLFLLYPVFPWLGLTGLGLVLGRILQNQKPNIKSLIVPSYLTGLLLMLGFILTKLTGLGSLYGSIYDSLNKTTNMSQVNSIHFLSAVKYPADLSYLFITTGLIFILSAIVLGLSEKTLDKFESLRRIGQEPLFFYFAHLILYAAFSPIFPKGASLMTMYGIWVLSIPILYLLTLLFSYLRRHIKESYQ